jgi:hypothetical protein
MIEKVLAAKAADPRLVVPTKVVLEMMQVGLTKLNDYTVSGRLGTVVDGRDRKYLTASVYDLVAELVAASHPADAPPAKVREVPSKFRRKPRPRTEAELLGLEKGNQRRHEEAVRRREAAAAGNLNEP